MRMKSVFCVFLFDSKCVFYIRLKLQKCVIWFSFCCSFKEEISLLKIWKVQTQQKFFLYLKIIFKILERLHPCVQNWYQLKKSDSCPCAFISCLLSTVKRISNIFHSNFDTAIEIAENIRWTEFSSLRCRTEIF